MMNLDDDEVMKKAKAEADRKRRIAIFLRLRDEGGAKKKTPTHTLHQDYDLFKIREARKDARR